MTSNQPTRWDIVKLYGVDHSPWVQGIRLALSYYGVPCRTTSLPVNWRWWFSQGVTFPVLQPDGQAPIVDSFAMYRALEIQGFSLGLDGVLDTDLLEAQSAMESMFSNYALGRSGPGKRWAFIRGWSNMRERPMHFGGSVARAFLAHYFFCLIGLGRTIRGQKGRYVYDLDKFERDIVRWDRLLQNQEWVTGRAIGALDFALMGHMQCMMTGLTDELIPILRRQSALMEWVGRMCAALPDYEPMYARRLIEDTWHQTTGGGLDRGVFWLTWFGCIAAWPVTLPFLLYCFVRRAYNPAHSGAVSRRLRRGPPPL